MEKSIHVSLRIPEELMKPLDEMAQSLSRSRSWVLVEAVRRMLAYHLNTYGDQPLSLLETMTGSIIRKQEDR